MRSRSMAALSAALVFAAVAGCGPASAPPSAGGPPGRGAAPTSSLPPASSSDDRSASPAPRAPRSEGRAPAPTSAPPTWSSGVPDAFAGVLAAHNEYRARHCAPPLSWSAELAEVAAGWADTLKFNDCAFEHSTSPYGENLAFFMPASTGERATRGWYEEVSLYDFSRPGFDMRTGHFTQIVWRATEHLGCAVAECNGGQIWVCNYDPPGNVEGLYRRNVLPTSCR